MADDDLQLVEQALDRFVSSRLDALAQRAATNHLTTGSLAPPRPQLVERNGRLYQVRTDAQGRAVLVPVEVPGAPPYLPPKSPTEIRREVEAEAQAGELPDQAAIDREVQRRLAEQARDYTPVDVRGAGPGLRQLTLANGMVAFEATGAEGGAKTFKGPDGRYYAYDPNDPSKPVVPLTSPALEAYYRRQQEADEVERSLRNRLAEGQLSLQQAQFEWRKYQDELDRLDRYAALEASREAQQLQAATAIAGQSVQALQDALRYLAAPGTAEDLARGLQSVQTGQPVPYQPRTAPFPYNPLEVSPAVARHVLGWLRQQAPGYAAYLEQAAALPRPGGPPFTAPTVPTAPAAPAAPPGEPAAAAPPSAPAPFAAPALPMPGRAGPF